jgi:hypothetical protein
MALAALLVVGAAARADLKWEATRLEFHPAVSDRDVTARFPFTNEGTEPVVIDAVETGCGCTTAALAKLTYQPGEKGSVQATFHIGERTGFQDKVIRVRIHGVQDPVVLTMATFIPELLKIEPHYVFWRLGDPPVPRIIKLTVLPDARLDHLHVVSSNPKFTAAIHPLQEGSAYLLVVTPTDTATDVSTVFAIEAMAGPAPGVANAPIIPKRFQAFANIIPK